MKKNIVIAFFLLFSAFALNSFASTPAVEVQTEEKQPYHSKTMSELVDAFYATTGIKALFQPEAGVKDSHGKEMTLFAQGYGRIIMIFICFLLF